MAAYPAQVKAAEDKYNKEMAEFNKKSLGTRILEKQLLDAKPVKQIPSKPYLENIAEPVLQKSYDYGTIASTYVNLEGYQNNPSNALKIKVILYGYDHTQPRTVNEQQDVLKFGNGGTRTGKDVTYHAEFSYRHPMALKVYTPDGKEVLNVTPPELNSYKIYRSNATTRPMDINSELLVKTSQEKILQDNLKFINNMVNDKFGYAHITRATKLYYIKDSDNQYPDLTTAFNEASSGLQIQQQDNSNAKAKLDKACQLWNTALNEADITNKKARINKDVALALYFNLLEAYLATGSVGPAQTLLDKMNSLSMSATERRSKLDFDILFADLKSRQQNNL
jgi:hypothetical protein